MIDILPKDQCVGCGACTQVCPVECLSMQADAEGFLYPHCDDSHCIGCNLCERTCPVLSTTTAPCDEPLDAQLAWTNCDDDLFAATSGGVFTALARQTVEAGGTVVGATYDEQFVVRHTVVRSQDDIPRVARSKYAQSDMAPVFRQVADLLTAGQQVLFGGTACQVYALKSYLDRQAIASDDLVLVDIVCHGVASPKLLSEYIAMQEARHRSKVVRIAMRERPSRARFGFTSSMRLDFANGKKTLIDMEQDVLGRFFLNDFATRPSCHHCPFKTLHRISDLTLGDCWFSRCLTGDDKTPYEVTLCLSHTIRGKELLERCPRLESVKIDAMQAVLANGGMLYSSSTPNPQRTAFMSQLGHVPLGQLSNLYFPNSPQRVVKLLRGFIKGVLARLAPAYVDGRAKRRQSSEFARRMARSIPQDAYAKRIFR